MKIGFLDRHNRVSAMRHWCARHDTGGFTGSNGNYRRCTCGNIGDHSQTTRRIRCGTRCVFSTDGKPIHRRVIEEREIICRANILRKNAIAAENLAMVGDRLYTDIAMARRVGALGVLVLTGETSEAQARASQPPPDLIVPSLAEFGERLREALGARVSI